MAQSAVTVRIGATLASGFSTQFNRANSAVTTLRSSVITLNTRLETLARRSNTTATSLNRVARSMRSVNTAMRSMGQTSSSAGTTRLLQQNAKLVQSYQKLISQHQLTVAQLRTGLPVMGGVGSRGGIGLRGGGAGAAAAVAASGGGGGKTPSGGLHGAMSGIGMWNMAGYGLTHAGFVGLGAGYGMYEGIKHVVAPAQEYVHQLALMQQLHMSNYEILQSTAQAWKLTKEMPAVTATQILGTIREVRTVFGNTEDAIKHVGTVMKVETLLGNLMEGGEAAHGEAYTLARALELKGGAAIQTPKGFEMMAESMSKALVALGGRINASDFLSAFKYGRAATAGWDTAFTTTILPTLIQEMKSAGGGMSGVGGPGAALRAGYDAIVGGQMTSGAAQQFMSMGLIDKGKVDFTKKGDVKRIQPGGVKGYETFITNPYLWTQQYLVPALHAKAGNDESKMRSIIQASFSNALARFAFTQMALPSQSFKFARDVKLYQQAGGFETLDELYKSDPKLMLTALKAQWSNFATQLGKSAFMEPFRHGVVFLTSKLSQLSQWMERNKDNPTFRAWAKGIGAAAIGLTGLFTIGGGILLVFGSMARAIEGIIILSKILGTVWRGNAAAATAQAVAGGAASAAGGGGAGSAAAAAGGSLLGRIGSGLGRLAGGAFSVTSVTASLAAVAATPIIIANWENIKSSIVGVKNALVGVKTASAEAGMSLEQRRQAAADKITADQQKANRDKITAQNEAELQAIHNRNISAASEASTNKGIAAVKASAALLGKLLFPNAPTPPGWSSLSPWIQHPIDTAKAYQKKADEKQDILDPDYQMALRRAAYRDEMSKLMPIAGDSARTGAGGTEGALHVHGTLKQQRATWKMLYGAQTSVNKYYKDLGRRDDHDETPYEKLPPEIQAQYHEMFGAQNKGEQFKVSDDRLYGLLSNYVSQPRTMTMENSVTITVPPGTDATGIADAVTDALNRLGIQLQGAPWERHLLTD